jgi:amyloid beta precursor protein binding protein 1
MQNAQKYDRQLRLWGDHGQKALSEAHVILFGATASGTETLKNLILPGIGKFTIVDEAKVTENDLENNFFLTFEDIGKWRGQVTMTLLSELNEGVKAEFFHELKTLPQDASIVIFSENRGNQFFKECQFLNIPFVQVRTFGLIGKMKIWSPTLYIVESKPDHALQNLRILDPFPELEAFVKSISKEDLHKCPWIVLIIEKLLRDKHRNLSKREFREELSLEAPDITKDTNYIEAVQAVFKSLNPFVLPSEPLLQKDYPGNFGKLVKAVRTFQEQTGKYPLAGILPDMASSSEMFILLQTIYHTKAEADAKIIAELSSTSLEEARTFCKNLPFLRVIEFDHEKEEIPNPWNEGLNFCDEFYQRHQRFPQNEQEFSTGDHIPREVILELCRFGGAQIHNIGAFMGGVASQEIIKLLTKQFVPLSRPLLYNGIDATTTLL